MSDELLKANARVIKVANCESCPFYGECKAWKKLTAKQRFALTCGVGIGKFILKDCHLDLDN